MLLSPHDLQILVRLGDGMSQSQIGNDLGLEQPAVSKAIHAAEQRLGLSLVHSDGRRVKLTNVGREVARAAAGVLMRIKGFDDLIGLLRAGRINHTRIIASNTPGTYVLPDVIVDFLRLHDDAQIDIEVVSMIRVWDEFISGAYDLAFTPQQPFPGAARAEALYTDPVQFFTAPGHRLAGRRDVALAELRDVQMVGKFSDAYWGRVKLDLEQRGCTFERCIDLNSPEAVKRIVRSGIGAGMLFGSTLKDELASGELCAFTVADVAHAQTYYMVRPPHDLSPLAERFCTFMRERLGPLRV